MGHLLDGFESGDVKTLGIDFVKRAQEKVRFIQTKLLATQAGRRSMWIVR